MSAQAKIRNILHRSKLIAVSRALGLLDSEQARRLSKDLKKTPAARLESNRDALYELYASGALDTSDLQELSEFAESLRQDVAWLVAPPNEENHTETEANQAINTLTSQGQNQTECAESSDSLEAIRDNGLQCDSRVATVAPPSPDSSSSQQSAVNDGVHMSDEYGASVADQPASSNSDAELETPNIAPSENVSSESKNSSSSKDKSRRGKKRRSSRMEEYNFEPTWDAKLGIFVRRVPRAFAKSAGDLFERATQTRNSTLTALLGMAVTLFLVVVAGMAWFNQQNKTTPLGAISDGRELQVESAAAPVPEIDPLDDVKRLASEQDFDGALTALEELSDSDIDVTSVKVGLLLAKGADLEARDELLESMDFESATWRTQFAVWLANTSAEHCSAAKEQIDNTESNASAQYRLKAWLHSRDVAGDWRYALSLLSDIENHRCELGDLLYRAAAHTRSGNYEDAQFDLQELQLRLDNPLPTEFAVSLCLGRLRTATEKLAGGLAGRIEKASQIR